MDKLYTFKEAAVELNVSWQTVRNWRADGRIEAFKMGNKWLIRQREINRLRRYGVQITKPKGEE